jgi:hypothetical protein
MLPSSNEPASRVKQPLDAVTYFLMLYKLALVGLLNALVHTCDEAGLLLKHAIHCFFHQLLSILAIRRGHLLEPHFDVRREMYFHTPKVGTS